MNAYNENRFMSAQIMPMSEAVVGYDLFDKMKVPKGTANQVAYLSR